MNKVCHLVHRRGLDHLDLLGLSRLHHVLGLVVQDPQPDLCEDTLLEFALAGVRQARGEADARAHGRDRPELEHIPDCALVNELTAGKGEIFLTDKRGF